MIRETVESRNQVVMKPNRLFSDKGPRFGVRHQQCILLFFCLFVMYTLSINLSLAIVAMTDKSTANPYFEEFQWNEQTKATVLSSFFWGYVLTQIPAGSLSKRYGGKIPLLIAVGGCSVINLLIPICTSLGGSNVLLALRMIQGLFQGALFPSTYTLLVHWAPAKERALLSVLSYPGAQVGTVVMMSTGGLIASSDLGWPGIFYIWGSAGLIWSALWWVFGANTPAEHKSITTAERNYIESTQEDHGQKQSIPWKIVLRSVSFYALLIAHCSHSFGFWILFTIVPTYLKAVLGMEIRQNALLSALPSAAMFILSQVFGILCKFGVKRWNWSNRTVRIAFNSIGLGIPGISFIWLSFMTRDNTVLAIVLLVTASGTNAAIYFGYYVNHMDLCPSHAGILFGVTNCIATLGGIFAILMVGWLVTDETNPKQWQIMFTITGAIYFVGTLVFMFFAKFENQNWVKSDDISTSVETDQNRENKNINSGKPRTIDCRK